MLEQLVDLMRERLRVRYLRAAKAAIQSIEQQVTESSDMLLVGQLDQLLAQQLQQVGTAELQADFAFVVIDPPVVPDRPHWPQPLIEALMALVLAPGVASGWLLVHHSRRQRMARPDAAPASQDTRPST
jgi:hypothetical protein